MKFALLISAVAAQAIAESSGPAPAGAPPCVSGDVCVKTDATVPVG